MVELLIVMGIMAILIVILSEAFGSILSLKLGSQAKTAVAQDSRYFLTRLGHDITRASALSTPDPNTLVLTIDGLTYTYSREEDQVLLSGDALTSVRTRITNLTFTELSTAPSTKPSVQVSLTIEPIDPNSGGVSGGRTLTTTYALR